MDVNACVSLSWGSDDRQSSDPLTVATKVDIRRTRVAEPGRVWARNKLSQCVGSVPSATSTPLSLFARLFHHSLFLYHSDYLGRLLRQSLPVVVRSSLSARLSRSHPSPTASIMTPRGGMIPEVKSERRNQTFTQWKVWAPPARLLEGALYTLSRIVRSRAKKIRFFRPIRSAFARTRVTREQLPTKTCALCRYLTFEEGHRKLRVKLMECLVEAPGFKSVNIRICSMQKKN